MAKQGHKGHDGGEQPMENGTKRVYECKPGRYARVASHIGSLKIKDASGRVHEFGWSADGKSHDLQVDKTYRVKMPNGEIVTKSCKVWRFERGKTLPFPEGLVLEPKTPGVAIPDVDTVVAPNDRDRFITVLNEWMNDLVEYDSADEFVLPNGQRGKRTIKLLDRVVSRAGGEIKREPISVEQFVMDRIMGDYRLLAQKEIYIGQKEDAEQTIRLERGISEPEKKTRWRKAAVAGELVEENEELSTVE